MNTEPTTQLPSRPPLPAPTGSSNVISFHPQEDVEVMRLDEQGMVYKGQRIEDGGEAHRAFLTVMKQMTIPLSEREIDCELSV